MRRSRPGSPGWQKRGSAIREEGEVGIAHAAPAALGQDQALPGGHEVFRSRPLSASKTRVPGGHRHDHPGAVFAMPVLAHTAAAVFRLEGRAGP